MVGYKEGILTSVAPERSTSKARESIQLDVLAERCEVREKAYYCFHEDIDLVKHGFFFFRP